jgi:hypothetical protein
MFDFFYDFTRTYLARELEKLAYFLVFFLEPCYFVLLKL